jgi:hypothetical protein
MSQVVSVAAVFRHIAVSKKVRPRIFISESNKFLDRVGEATRISSSAPRWAQHIVVSIQII